MIIVYDFLVKLLFSMFCKKYFGYFSCNYNNTYYVKTRILTDTNKQFYLSESRQNLT